MISPRIGDNLSNNMVIQFVGTSNQHPYRGECMDWGSAYFDSKVMHGGNLSVLVKILEKVKCGFYQKQF